jgi:hypothetical protein
MAFRASAQQCIPLRFGPSKPPLAVEMNQMPMVPRSTSVLWDYTTPTVWHEMEFALPSTPLVNAVTLRLFFRWRRLSSARLCTLADRLSGPLDVAALHALIHLSPVYRRI